MAGTYNGGGTLIGYGRPWAVEPTYDQPKRKGKPAPVPVSLLSQKELLSALGISNRTMQTRKRGYILKRLVAEGVLLDTGRPNPNNPRVSEIIKSKARQAKAQKPKII